MNVFLNNVQKKNMTDYLNKGSVAPLESNIYLYTHEYYINVSTKIDIQSSNKNNNIPDIISQINSYG